MLTNMNDIWQAIGGKKVVSMHYIHEGVIQLIFEGGNELTLEAEADSSDPDLANLIIAVELAESIREKSVWTLEDLTC